MLGFQGVRDWVVESYNSSHEENSMCFPPWVGMSELQLG